MRYEEGKIQGVVITPLKKYKDNRGWLTELFRNDEIKEEIKPVMSYISMTYPGITRGPHEHLNQTDLFAFITARFKLTLWDNRKGNNTKMSITTKEDEPILVEIPPGVVHSYTNISNIEGLVLNFPNKLFKGENKKESIDEIRYEENVNSPFKL